MTEKEKVVILFGSPRKNGFTRQLVNSFLKQYTPEQIELMYLNAYQMQVQPCIDCRQCLTGICPFNQKDDMGEILSILSTADVVVLASPIYFFNYPTPLKAIIDRCQQFFHNRAENRAKMFPNPAKGYILLTSGADHPDASQVSLLAGKMFFQSIHVSFQDSTLMENTDSLVDPENITAVS